jgi:hypothetical protein
MNNPLLDQLLKDLGEAVKTNNIGQVLEIQSKINSWAFPQKRR